MIARLALLGLLVAARPADEVRVTVTTKDGDRIKGVLSVASFKIKGGFGEMTIDFAKVTLIEFGTQDVVTTLQKTTLKGRILVEDWKLRSDVGDLPLKRDRLASIALEGTASTIEKGKISDGASPNGMTWHVRLPSKFDPKKGGPAILIFHGSNVNSRAYVNMIAQAWPKLAEDYVLLGINGENRVKGSPDANPAYNYTYVNFAGKSRYGGFPGTDRESPALVAEVVEELRGKLGLTKIFVGGHSQGGFLTYSCAMNYPELFAGAFPVSGGLIVQAEPSAYEGVELRARQRRLAVAIVHGENDQAVDFSMGQSAYESFLDQGFPALRFVTHKTAAHMFGALPVEEAVRWLEAMTADDPAALLEAAQKRLLAKEYRDAWAAADRARGLDTAKKHAARIKAVLQAVDKEAAAEAKTLEAAIKEAKGNAWVAAFFKYRAQFEFAEGARGVMEAYRGLRVQHEKAAEELWNAARQEFQAKNTEEGYRKYEEIVKKYFGSSWYRYARRALDDRR